ncbi:CAP-Gly domain-containing linker protein 4 [Latimeria chalumnae]|uniref:CAP-Gly domain-containing linker protein 4 n=1 Tax=Latimeria chalumnae TaxID=7897 RepID=UPI00313AC707
MELGSHSLAGAEETREQLQCLEELSGSILKRLAKAEEEIQWLKSETMSRQLQEQRQQELVREVQDLKEQILATEVLGASTGTLTRLCVSENQSAAICGQGEKSAKKSHCSAVLHPNEQEEVMMSCKKHHFPSRDCCSLSDCQASISSSVMSFISRPSSSSSSSPASFQTARRSITQLRAFVPHCHLDLQMGHRVKVLLPSGRVGTGTVRFLGHLPNVEEFFLGVDLETPEYGQHDGVYAGRCYFHCKPGHGVFVPFSKVLMAWE